ncbi:MAG: MFS transporter [Blastocatellia bacterium]
MGGLLADHHGSRHRGRAIGFHTAGLGFGAIAGSTVAGYLGEHHGWRSSFLILGAAGIILSLIAAVVLRGKDVPAARASASATLEASKTGAETGGVFRALIRLPSYWALLAQSMIMSVGIWLFLNWLPLFFKESFGMSLAGSGFYSAALLELPGPVGVILGGSLSDYIARRNSAGRMLVQTICYVIGAVLFCCTAVAEAATSNRLLCGSLVEPVQVPLVIPDLYFHTCPNAI